MFALRRHTRKFVPERKDAGMQLADPSRAEMGSASLLPSQEMSLPSASPAARHFQ